MRLTSAHARLLAMNQPVFTTADAAACLGIENGHASKTLTRLSQADHLVSLGYGLWAFGDRVKKFALAQYMTAPFPSYVSLQSALYYHGMISQIPSVTYAVSIARPRRLETPWGAISIHHVNPAFFFGYEPVGDQGAKIAVPEKALLDVLYLSPAKTRLFRVLPELELPKGFSMRRARVMINRIQSAQRRTLVAARFEECLPRTVAA